MTTTYVPALEIRKVSVAFSAGHTRFTALSEVELSFRTGTFTSVMGPSGSGKSTLLNCAAGLQQTSGGQVLVEGQDITRWDESQLARLRSRRLGFVFQSFQLVPYLTASQNVALPRRLSGRRVDDAEIAYLLGAVGLEDRGGQLPSALSGGQQQRIAIARALANDPAVVLADEPTGALDSRTALEVLALLRRCVDDLGQTVVMVTHDPRTAAFADSVVFLVDGRVAGQMQRPTPEAVAGQLAHLDQLTGAGAA
jgi:putative ABC transport system ATP-binding protein